MDANIEYRPYLFEYRHDGVEYGIQIVASSPQDARERLRSLPFARYCGEVRTVVRVPTPIKLIRAIRGWFNVSRFVESQ